MHELPVQLFPDFGNAVCRHIGNEPFHLSIFAAGRTQVTQQPFWSISLILSSYHLTPAILLTEPHMLTIELPGYTQAQAFAFVDRLKSGEVLMLQVRQERKYRTSLGEWVYPVYLINGIADLRQIAKARAKRQRRAADDLLAGNQTQTSR